MNSDIKLFKWLAIIVLVPLVIALFGGDRFRYPCQDPENWDKSICKMPACDVTRTCPEHIFKGQRDPRLGPPIEAQNVLAQQELAKGVNCGK
jgi:hypothetical protein